MSSAPLGADLRATTGGVMTSGASRTHTIRVSQGLRSRRAMLACTPSLLALIAASPADALQRVPGVSIQRVGARGEASGITVRGFGGDFNDTLYDGRHVSTVGLDRNGNPSRAVDFTTVGADFIGQVNVLKTPDVELS